MPIRREERREHRPRRVRPAKNVHQKNRISELWGRYGGEDIFVVGTGTSLRGFNWERLRSRTCIALNDAVLVPGFAPAFHLFCDVGIWSRYRDHPMHPNTRVVCQAKSRDQFLRYERCSFRDQVWHFNHVPTPDGCVKGSDDLYISRTVATGGIMLAFKLGARRVFLLGVDGYKRPDAYYYDGAVKPKETRKENGLPDGRIVQDRHEWWSKNMDELRRWFDKLGVYQEPYRYRGSDGKPVLGSNVFNLSGLSTIDAWQRVKVKTVLGKGCFS